jgi:predicted transcriptional regulator|tara:strand:+ start:618 stop:809 length:192 start_codon:yes stop_codon:yes gene_type:complete
MSKQEPKELIRKSILLTKETNDYLKKLSKFEDRSESSIIRQSLKNNKLEEQNQLRQISQMAIG